MSLINAAITQDRRLSKNNCLSTILVRLVIMCSINSFEKMQFQLITMHAQNTALNYLETAHSIEGFHLSNRPIRTRSLASPNIITPCEILVHAKPQRKQKKRCTA